MSDKIQPHHLARLAIVYIRQSSPGQVKNHPESYRVQKGLAKRAAGLGWPEEKIRVVQSDLGISASQPGKRDGFNDVLQWVQDKQVGIVLGQDASRLARNSLDWSLMTHWCALHGSLLGDQHQVLDPALPQDSLMLGIQGALAVHELHTIRQRMEQASRQKASRGELQKGVPRGYVVVDRRHLRKHPDRRVRAAIQRVFQKFETCSSVGQLLSWLWKKNYLLPKSARPGNGTGIQYKMVEANYRCLVDMLQNPKYAGVYVYPRYLKETTVLADGTVTKTTRRMRPDQWQVRLVDQHPAYITLAQYEANQEKIAMNAPRFTPTSRGAANRGRALLAGLIVCRRCHHKLRVRYRKCGGVTYYCQQDQRQRERGGSGCFIITADELERQLSEQILYAVGPAGVKAALVAGERMAAERATRRSLLSDELQELCYNADLARRRFDNVDPANRLVLDTLAAELEAALEAVSQQEARLARFDRDQLPRPTAAEQAALARLGSRLETVWYDPQSDGRLKQQIVRVLVKHVLADVDDATGESVLWVHWAGGHHTELRAKRRGRPGRKPSVDLVEVIDTIRKIADDEEISRSLNRCGVRTERGESWTKRRVQNYRARKNIAAYSAKLHRESGWLSQAQAATKLEISPMSLNRLIQRGVLNSEGTPGLPQLIQLAELSREEVITAVRHIKSHGNSPLPEDPKQLTLFPQTTCVKGAS
jgi:DNA invertase Pin-like site-specific DNA recombinase